MKPLLITTLLSALALSACSPSSVPQDDTDPPNGRSGMILAIDNRTGCHYLMNPRGGITPRLAPNGQQICDSK